MQEGFLFKENKLCIPKSPLRDLIIKEAHGATLAGYLGINETMKILKDHFYWPKMGGDVHKVISRCNIAKWLTPISIKVSTLLFQSP